MNNRFRVFVQRQDYGQRVGIYVSQEFDGNKIGIIKPIEIETIDKADVCLGGDPMFYMPDEFGQQLIDELYRAGYRPSQEGGAGEIHAIKNHLEDMRSLVKGLKK